MDEVISRLLAHSSGFKQSYQESIRSFSTFQVPAAYISPLSYELRLYERGAAAGRCSLSAGRQQTHRLVKISRASHEILLSAQTGRAGGDRSRSYESDRAVWSDTNLQLSRSNAQNSTSVQTLKVKLLLTVRKQAADWKPSHVRSDSTRWSRISRRLPRSCQNEFRMWTVVFVTCSAENIDLLCDPVPSVKKPGTISAYVNIQKPVTPDMAPQSWSGIDQPIVSLHRWGLRFKTVTFVQVLFRESLCPVSVMKGKYNFYIS